tara:strand:- start:1428 stop:4355 length:2928 start_codon:yes stop_codon:yes gene_type:complete
MENSTLSYFIKSEVFKKLPKSIIEKLSKNAQIVKFSLGDTLVEEDKIPANILLIKNGYARLMGEIDGKTSSFGKFGSGTLLGAPSLLSGRSCENFIATDDLEAFSIHENFWVDLYINSIEFKNWCDNFLFPQEIIHLIRALDKISPRRNSELHENIKQALSKAFLVDPLKLDFKSNSDEKREIFLCCNWDKRYKDFQKIDPLKFEYNSKIFNPRLISIPVDLSNNIIQDYGNNLKSYSTQDANVTENVLNTSSQYNADIPLEEKIKLITRKGQKQQIVACFQMISNLLNIPLRKDSIDRVVSDIISQGYKPTLQNYGQIAASLGLRVIKASVSIKDGNRLQFPSLIEWDGVLSIILKSNRQGIVIASPDKGIINLNLTDFNNHYQEGVEYLIIEKIRTTPVDRFGLSWFLPIIKKYKNVLLQVIIASFVVQLFTLANPLIIQVIIDKVINQRSLDTLQVLGIALLVLTLVEGILGSLKTFLFVETTNRIDQKLGSEVIDHLLRLPLEYFDRRPVGELGTRIGELEKIRNFITGRGLSTILDAGYSLIYIGVMLLYSSYLTLIALIVLPIQVALTIIGAPLFRKQFRESAEDNAKTQSHLIEVITGIQTVKAQNIETTSRWRWQDLYSKYIASSFKKTITGTVLNQTSQVLQKISQLLVLWIGASMVLDGQLTLGQLIAFRIISGYVTQPILRLTTIWQNVQELRVSFERLGDVINTNTESDENDRGKLSLPNVSGLVKFNNVSFNFQYNLKPVLNKINLDIPIGSFVGIVGKSGSGKSTLMKLLSRLYSPNEGIITIDNYDIDKVELYSLRRQIGIVPQDPLLFSGTITENISGDNDECSEQEIVEAAKISESHDFIMQMSSGYNTKIGERGSSISGGQRQRIAIARTLFSKPKILIFDEATSALDFETERKVVTNLKDNFDGCTIFFITHRLATVSKADIIVMMEDGCISETGTFDNLMSQKGTFYSLYKQQEL